MKRGQTVQGPKKELLGTGRVKWVYTGSDQESWGVMLTSLAFVFKSSGWTLKIFSASR